MTQLNESFVHTVGTPKKPFSLRTAALIAGLPFIMYGLFGDARMAVITAVGFIWLYYAVLGQNLAFRGLSAARIYLPIFFIYSGVSFLGPPMLHTTDMIVMCALSGFAFCIGWIVAFPPARKLQGEIRNAAPLLPGPFFRRPLVIFAAIITCLAYVYCYAQAGGLPVMSVNPNVARVTFLINGYVSTVVVVGLHIMIACGFIELFVLRGRRAKVFPAALCIVGTSLALAMSNRGIAVNPLVFGLLFVLWQKNYRLRRLVPVGLIAVAILSIAGYVRNLSSWGDTYIADLQLQGFSGAGILFAPIINYVYGTAQTFDSTISVFPATLPLQSGQQFFSPLLMKPSVDLYLKNVFGYDFEGFGLALGSVNAFYLDWGVVGTFIGPLIVGFSLGLVYRRSLLGSVRWSVLYTYLLMQLLFSVYGHPFAYLFYIIEPILFFFLVDQKNGRSHSIPLISRPSLDGLSGMGPHRLAVNSGNLVQGSDVATRRRFKRAAH